MTCSHGIDIITADRGGCARCLAAWAAYFEAAGPYDDFQRAATPRSVIRGFVPAGCPLFHVELEARTTEAP